MILKAGTYTFVDTPTITSAFNQEIECEFTITVEDGVGDVTYHCTSFVVDDENNLYLYCDYVLANGEQIDVNSNVNFYYLGAFEWDAHSVSILADSEVADEFGTTFIANTDYNEVNGSTETPLVELTYNGETLSLEAGDKATIPCAEFKMRSDVVVKVNKVEAPTTEEITVTPSTTAQEVTPTNADYISKVTVQAIPSEYQKVVTVSTEDEALDETTIPIVEGQIIVVEG